MDVKADADQKEIAYAGLRTIKRQNFDQFLGYLYIKNADQDRHGSLTTGLETQCSLEHDQHPKTLLDAHNVISNHCFDANHKAKKKKKQDKPSKKNDDKRNQDPDKNERESKVTVASIKNHAVAVERTTS